MKLDCIPLVEIIRLVICVSLSPNLVQVALLDGAHPNIKPKPVRITKLAYMVKMIDTSFPVPKFVKNKVNLLRNKMEKEHPEFLESEEMRIQCPRRCNRCNNCSDCSVSAQQLTRKEQVKLILMENNMWVNKEKKRTVVRYPIIKDPSLLTNNYGQAGGKIIEGQHAGQVQHLHGGVPDQALHEGDPQG
jgi:hypothetical protein